MDRGPNADVGIAPTVTIWYCVTISCMDRSDPDTIVMVAGIVITLVALVELYPLLTGSDDD